MIKILLVEDDTDIVKSLTDFLSGEGFFVKSARGQAQATALFESEEFDLALVDVSLADGNGFSVCAEITAKVGIPVIFLTASSDELSTVAGFELGACDYIAKPFRPRELVMRIKNSLRLSSHASPTVKISNIVVDTVKGTVTKDGRELYLSALEYRLLLVFLNNRGCVLSRAQLLDAIWDSCGEFVNDNTLTVYIKRLRDKIEDNSQEPRIIKTVRGLGYRVD